MTQTTELLRVAEVAQRLALSKSLVYRLIEQGELSCVEMGVRAKRVPSNAVESYIQSHQKNADA